MKFRPQAWSANLSAAIHSIDKYLIHPIYFRVDFYIARGIERPLAPDGKGEMDLILIFCDQILAQSGKWWYTTLEKMGKLRK